MVHLSAGVAVNQSKAIDALNRMLALHESSLPMYLAGVSTWVGPNGERVVAALNDIVADQQRVIERTVELLLDAAVPIRHGKYPMEFTDLHDLSVEFLIGRLVEQQREFLAAIKRYADDMSGDAEFAALAEEAIGLAQGHLESLEELQIGSQPRH
jgi:uncharacterized coiled-coil protein SlyX